MDTDNPRVFFRTEAGAALNLSWGYLCIIDGVPWLAATPEEAQSRIPATMLRLDPQHLEAQRDSETGDQYFLYRPVLQRI